MKLERFDHRSRIDAPAPEVFAWHERPGAFERLLPPWDRTRVLERSGGIRDGGRVTLAIPLIGPAHFKWVLEHRDYEAGRQFRDVQVPVANWIHTHRVEPDGPTACFLENKIEYKLPFGMLGRLVIGGGFRRELEKRFQYSHRILSEDLTAHARFRNLPRRRILITGSHGMIGSALAAFLATGGHDVRRLVRGKPANNGEFSWDPLEGVVDPAALEGVDAVVHLAGENLAAGRWTEERKARIRDSRIRGTRTLCEAMARVQRRSRVLVSASAIGFYGHRGDEILTEASSPGAGFLAEVCRQWEAAAYPVQEEGVRVVHLRLGVVLSPSGGALAKMLPAFRFGLGGRLGSGRQSMSWIALDDAVDAIHHAIMTPALRGPLNAVAPHPVTNREFTATLARLLHRPALVPVPAWALRLALGEMADQALLASARVLPERLQATGFLFRHPDLEEALRAMLGR